MKRTIEISSEAVHLAMLNEQLVVKRQGQVVDQIPCQDVGVVVVDHPQTTYTHGALSALSAAGAAVVLCGRNHLPAAMLLPLPEHSEVVWRLDAQLNASRPLRKQLWTQLVVAKIEAQADNLEPTLPAHHKLQALAREVRSGDPTNVEAWAARVYWEHWLDDPAAAQRTKQKFRRDPALDGVNSLLNYGYAIVRAALARAIVAAGLLPSLGLHHRRRGNAFCLADDLIEPLRPLVDRRVRDLYRAGFRDIGPASKEGLLGILAERVRIDDGDSGPLMVQIHRCANSLVDCYAGDARQLRVPRPIQEVRAVE